MLIRTIALALLAILAGQPLTAQAGATPKLRPEMLVTTEWLAGHLNDPGL